MPRSSASGWRCRVSEKRRIRTSSRASRKMITAAGCRAPRARRASRRTRAATSPARTSRTIAVRAKRRGSLATQVREVGQQLARQVVDDDVAEVLEQLRRRGLAAARQAGDDDDLLGAVLARRRSARVAGVAASPRSRSPRPGRPAPRPAARYLPLRRMKKMVPSNRMYIVSPGRSG